MLHLQINSSGEISRPSSRKCSSGMNRLNKLNLITARDKLTSADAEHGPGSRNFKNNNNKHLSSRMEIPPQISQAFNIIDSEEIHSEPMTLHFHKNKRLQTEANSENHESFLLVTDRSQLKSQRCHFIPHTRRSSLVQQSLPNFSIMKQNFDQSKEASEKLKEIIQPKQENSGYLWASNSLQQL